jgi:radical SAM protein with 4Fe4S-binding SPASM domain
MRSLEERITAGGLDMNRGISKHIRMNHCMAHSGKAVTIFPDGNIGLCEQFSETEFIGHIDRKGFDQKVIASWKERMPAIPECTECALYPECVKLKKCSTESICYSQFRQGQLRITQRRMINEYNNWKNHIETEEEDDTDTTDRL